MRQAGPGGEVEPEEEAARRRELDELIGLRALLDATVAQGARGGETQSCPRWHVREDTAEAALEAFDEDTVVRAVGAAGAAKVAVGEWRELCTHSAPPTGASTAPEKKGRSLAIMGAEGGQAEAKIMEAAAGPLAEARAVAAAAAAAAAAVDAAAEPAEARHTTVAAIETVGSDAPVQASPRGQGGRISLGPECVVVVKPGDELPKDEKVLEVRLAPRRS